MEAQNDNAKEITVGQMRKSVEKLGSSTKEYGDKALTRFLVASSMDPEKAAKMFVKQQKRRVLMVPNGFGPGFDVHDELEAKKIYLQGLTKHGFPVMIVKVCKHFLSRDLLQVNKFVVHLLDKTIAIAFKAKEMGDEKLIGILGLKGIKYKNVDAQALITGFHLLLAYYLERL